MDSQVRQNFHRDCEAAINRMINMELFASYTYTSMVSPLTPTHHLHSEMRNFLTGFDFCNTYLLTLLHCFDGMV